ncbi:hypothetical protein LV469_07030 [Peptoniphilus sp. GNH]|nr:hypothetical protein HMPREF3189_00773 [Clostridiales bacterium KA00134]UHR02392.1 hypothetical protein LV469_07030 [Peptoniphilus sp. GNH]
MEKKKNLSPKIVFRYQEELLTFFNKATKRYVRIMWFILFMVMVAFVFLNKEELTSNYLYFFVAFAVLLSFTGFIYKKTLVFSKRLGHFVKDGIKTRGQIIGTKVSQRGSRKFLHLVVEYKDPRDGNKKEFITDAVTGNPYELLHNLNVDVYILGDELMASGFNLKVDK